MTQEEKELLLRDLSARLPYGVLISLGQYDKNPVKLNSISITNVGTFFNGYFTKGIHFTFNGNGDIWPKPYLRSMSSMTEEEEIYYNTIYTTLKFYEREDWLNAHHFDYRGLIEKGLALEAPEGMYNLKEQ